ncbi:two component sensor histidine kinase [Sporosarcina newyorkensis 2681]|uniref:histidine kinase n=2 Tax=Sporosarcina newyorkensis TaxID=759851 RepID=F9DPT2_9BACL|nr:two component sensor histidine kinase [Sporosarcina newyorkensis 2681]
MVLCKAFRKYDIMRIQRIIFQIFKIEISKLIKLHFEIKEGGMFMVLKSTDINKFLESSLFKIIINHNGEILGMTKAFKSLVKENDLPKYISEIFDERLLVQIENILVHSSFQQITVQERVKGCLKDDCDKHVSCYIIYQPRSEKAIITIKMDEQTKTLSQLYESAFQTAKIPMALVNEWGFFVSLNEEFNKTFFDPTRGTSIHLKSFLENFHHDEEFCYTEYVVQAKNEGVAQRKLSYQKNGDIQYFNLLLEVDSATEMFILRVLDMTEQEHMLQLLAHSDQLSTTGEIAASIAHEVRNPMTTLHGFLQLLEHEVTGSAHKYVTVIQGEVKRMNEILNEMLALSKPRVDEVTVFSLTVLMEEVLLLLQPKALLDQINLFNENFITEPILIKANPNRVKQILVNLLKNAMEAMGPKGTLTVHVCEGEQQNVDILISDTGTGMSEEMMEKIFLPFVSGKAGGTGLGLPFVKKTVTEYGGSIAVSSEEGVGSVFKLTFPRVSVVGT